MKNIAFKRAKHSPQTKDSLHPEFITEFADTTLFPEGFHKAEDGYEILSEDAFQKELAKNSGLHQQFLVKKRQLELSRQAALNAEAKKLAVEDKKMDREYEEFKRWKATKNKKR